MAGRGRGATLPAWMTANGGDVLNGNGNGVAPIQAAAPPSYNPQPIAGGQYDDYSSAPPRSTGYVSQAVPANDQMPPHYSGAPPQEQFPRRGPSASRDNRGGDHRERLIQFTNYKHFISLFLIILSIH